MWGQNKVTGGFVGSRNGFWALGGVPPFKAGGKRRPPLTTHPPFACATLFLSWKSARLKTTKSQEKRKKGCQNGVQSAPKIVHETICFRSCVEKVYFKDYAWKTISKQGSWYLQMLQKSDLGDEFCRLLFMSFSVLAVLIIFWVLAPIWDHLVLQKDPDRWVFWGFVRFVATKGGTWAPKGPQRRPKSVQRWLKVDQSRPKGDQKSTKVYQSGPSTQKESSQVESCQIKSRQSQSQSQVKSSQFKSSQSHFNSESSQPKSTQKESSQVESCQVK